MKTGFSQVYNWMISVFRGTEFRFHAGKSFPEKIISVLNLLSIMRDINQRINYWKHKKIN